MIYTSILYITACQDVTPPLSHVKTHILLNSINNYLTSGGSPFKDTYTSIVYIDANYGKLCFKLATKSSQVTMYIKEIYVYIDRKVVHLASTWVEHVFDVHYNYRTSCGSLMKRHILL
jgi:hypothetical protein